MSRSIAAMATAPGKASLCVVRMSGDDAFSIAKKVVIPMNKNTRNEAILQFLVFCVSLSTLSNGCFKQ